MNSDASSAQYGTPRQFNQFCCTKDLPTPVISNQIHRQNQGPIERHKLTETLDGSAQLRKQGVVPNFRFYAWHWNQLPFAGLKEWCASWDTGFFFCSLHRCAAVRLRDGWEAQNSSAHEKEMHLILWHFFVRPKKFLEFPIPGEACQDNLFTRLHFNPALFKGL